MDNQTKVKFTFSIGLSGVGYEEYFTLEELGYDENINTDLEDFLENEWRNNYIDGGWKIEES